MLETLPSPSSLKQQAYTVSQSFWESGVILALGLSWSSCQNVVWDCNWAGRDGPSWDRSHPVILCCGVSLKNPDKSACLCAKLLQCLTDLMDCSLWGSSVCSLSQQDYLCGLPCSPPGEHPNSGTKPMSLYSLPALAGRLLPGKPTQIVISHAYFLSFSDAKTTTKWKKLTTWRSWALSPQTFGHLTINNVNCLVTSPSTRELCMSWSHAWQCPSLTWPLKMLSWSLSKSSEIWGTWPPI